MKLFGVVTAIIAAVTCVSALPSGPSPSLKRALGGVLLCQGANATGECHYEAYTLDECHMVPPAFYKNTLTFAPDGDDFYCWPKGGFCNSTCHSPTGCTYGGALYFDNPAKYDLTIINWQNNLASFDCHKNTTSN